MPFSATERNRVADSIVANELTIRVHTDDPGTNGTANRIGTASATLAAANWSDASAGAAQYNAAVALGVLDNSAQQIVDWYSLWRSSTFVGSEEMSSDVTVVAGGTFTIPSGQLRVSVASM